MLVLEIGCGDGTRSETIAKECQALIGIDPDEKLLETAIGRNLSNVAFSKGSATKIPFSSSLFNVVIFTLSFHHVPVDDMHEAINEALRVMVSDGHIVFLEPDTDGSFFDAEIRFDACDGDEREAKREAYEAMLAHPMIELVREFYDETIFDFDSLDDFVTSMKPKGDIGGLKEFLIEHSLKLIAKRRINIFRFHLP
jgi:ubiquinone/menaquinone biosynthesis C-methylase UbiE